MNTFKDQYKRRPAGFNDTYDGRLVRADRQEQRRRANRADNFARNRDVSSEVQEVRASRNSDLSARLRRWKEERALKKKIEASKKKPVFKVGVVHHNFYSPVHDNIKTKTQRCHPRSGQKAKTQPTPPKRITRATQKRLEAKNLASAATSGVSSVPKITPRPARQRKKHHSAAQNIFGKSFAPANHVFTAPSGIKEIPMFGRIAIPEISTDEPFCMINVVELDAKTAVANPWPTVESKSNNAEQTSRMRNELKRQMAFDSSSETSLPTVHDRRTSTDFSLRLSSEDESATRVSARDGSPLAEDVEAPIATPPLSGSPVPASFSPYIVTSRGKDRARKEQQNRMGIRRSSSNEIPTKDTVMQNLNISVEEEEQTAQYFKFLLHRETDRLNDLCDKWDVERTEPSLSEDAVSQIVAAIGQTKLLMRKKFERFRSLIHDCETGKGQMLVRCKDLGGFWDLIDREVKDCDARFSKLDFLKAHDWIEEVAVVKKVTKRNPAPAKPKINVKSAARSWILAARKKKMALDAGIEEDVVTVQEFIEAASSTTEMPESPKEPERRRRTSTPKNPKELERSRHASMPKTPMSLLKIVQLSEASKDVTSPLAVMKVSKMFKTPEVKMDDTISYVNSDQTPAKGILKKSEESSSGESYPSRSERKVDFNDDVFLEEIPASEIDGALQNSLDLGRALARIDSYDSESDFVEPCDPTQNSTVRTVEKRLDFENESFDEPENSYTAESAAIEAAVPEPCVIPNIAIIEPTPIKTMKTPVKNHQRSTRAASNIAEVRADEVKEPVNTRVLRNRMVVVETPNGGNRRSAKFSSANETITRSPRASTKENADPQKETASEFSNVLGTDHDNVDHTKRRRSSRKSVRFNPDDCTACGEASKPVQPMTPHARRSKKLSLLGDRFSEPSVEPFIGGDLMSFDTPTKIPARIRRSSRK